jgi:hypothetical protein
VTINLFSDYVQEIDEPEYFENEKIEYHPQVKSNF